LPVLCVPPLYLLAWLRPDSLGADASGVVLIAGACLALTGLAAGLAPTSWLTAGLVLLVVLDVILVWGDRQVEPAMTALQAAAPPTVGRELPDLQLVTFQAAVMGWLDFAAPALLGLLVARRLAATVATGVAGGLWALLFFATSPIAATPPVLAGLAAGRRRRDQDAGLSQTETWFRLSPVKGSRFQPLLRSRKRMPASSAIKSSSDGQT
jgi:hypothetical protein